MPIRITTASQPEEVERLFRARHDVFVGIERAMPPRPDGRIYDHFDAMAGHENIVAIIDDEVVGAVRLSLGSTSGLPSDEFYDFSKHLRGEYKQASVGMLFIRPEYRGNPRLLAGMFMLGYHWLVKHGVTHATVPANPPVRPHLERIGFKGVGGNQTSGSGLPFVPMVLEVSKATAPFLDYVKKQNMLAFMEYFRRDLYDPGEQVMRQGESGDRCYVVAAGMLEVRSGREGDGPVIAELGPGDLFGEVAMLTRLKRTASVVATSHVEVMSLSREEFLSEMARNPERCMKFLELLGERLRSVLEQSGLGAGALESLVPRPRVSIMNSMRASRRPSVV